VKVAATRLARAGRQPVKPMDSLLASRCASRGHCHDERHVRMATGINDKAPVIEEPDAGKLARPVLKPSGGGDSVA
jgi:hypothetical protein